MAVVDEVAMVVSHLQLKKRNIWKCVCIQIICAQDVTMMWRVNKLIWVHDCGVELVVSWYWNFLQEVRGRPMAVVKFLSQN